MKARRIPTVMFMAIALSSCASVSRDNDQICPEIAQFANAGGKAMHSVELTTDWGSTFSEEKNTLFTKHCEHGGYAPGAKLCEYLMQNTSTEFPTVNFRRALRCLSAEAYVPPSPVSVEHLEATVSSYSARGVKADIPVQLEFSTGSAKTPPSLKISAGGP